MLIFLLQNYLSAYKIKVLYLHINHLKYFGFFFFFLKQSKTKDSLKLPDQKKKKNVICLKFKKQCLVIKTNNTKTISSKIIIELSEPNFFYIKHFRKNVCNCWLLTLLKQPQEMKWGCILHTNDITFAPQLLNRYHNWNIFYNF